jgi:DNA-binding MarR family transcriptional regulator
MNQQLKSSIGENLALTLLRFKRFGFHGNTKAGIRQSEFMMLATIVHSDEFRTKGAKTTELSTHLRITPSGVTHIIASLVGKNYVERLGDSSDRRIVLIKPTAEGKKLVDSMVMRIVKRCEGLADYLGEKDSKELIRLLGLAFGFFNNGRE